MYSLMDDLAAAAGWLWMQVIDHLDEQMVGYIERSPFLQLGTADAEGLPFVSPKGDHAVRKRRALFNTKKRSFRQDMLRTNILGKLKQ